jgi:hypothetical protein
MRICGGDGRDVEPITKDDSRPYGPAMPATTGFGDLLQPAVVYSRAQVLARPSPVPYAARLYAIRAEVASGALIAELEGLPAACFPRV